MLEYLNIRVIVTCNFRDANLEDIINRLLNKSNAAAADGQGSSWGASHPGTENRWGQGGASAASAAANAAKKNRRKKKRH